MLKSSPWTASNSTVWPSRDANAATTASASYRAPGSPRDLPIAVGQGDQAGAEGGDDPGSRVGDRVDALTFREHEDDVLPVVVEDRSYPRGA